MIGSILDWVVTEGWQDFADRYNLQFKDAHEFRQRYILRAIRERGVL